MFDELFAQSGLSLDRLRTLCSVAEAGGIANAAQGDPTRQSLYSRQLRELESYFGTELTRRRGKGIELTDAGLQLATLARTHLSGLLDFKKAAGGEPSEIRIATNNSVLEWLLIPALSRLSEEAPPARIALSVARTREIIQGLRDHSVDLGLVRKNALVNPLRFRAIATIEYALFVPAPWSGGKRTPFDLLRRHPLALPVGGEFKEQFEKACEKAGESIAAHFACSSFTQAAELVRQGAAMAVLPTIAAAALSQEKVCQLPFPVLHSYRRTIGLAWHPRLPDLRPVCQGFLTSMENAMRNRS